MGARFRIPAVVFEGVQTGDNRFINVGALSTRALPLTLMGMTVNPEMGGHGLAVVAGRIDALTRVDASGMVDEATGQTWADVAGGPVWAWEATGEFTDEEDGQLVQRLVASQALRGVSVDLGAMEAEEEILAEDEEGFPTDWRIVVTAAEIAAATVCNVPAFRGATIELLTDEPAEGDPAVPAAPATEEEVAAIAASAAAVELPPVRILAEGPGCDTCPDDPTAVTSVTASGGPVRPPAAWFADPGLDGPTPLAIDDDGRVYGHLALWGTCHTGYPGQCVTPPTSRTAYALFQLGAVRCADGTDVAVGHITMGTGHAPMRSNMAAAAEHYDNTGTVVADVMAGEDAHGIYVAGAVRPSATDEQVRALRASKLSGDWRAYGGRLELMAALAVNVPGFPVPRPTAQVASGAVVALVASGAGARALDHADDTVDPAVVVAALTPAQQLRASLAAGEAVARATRAGRAYRWGRPARRV